MIISHSNQHLLGIEPSNLLQTSARYTQVPTRLHHACVPRVPRLVAQLGSDGASNGPLEHTGCDAERPGAMGPLEAFLRCWGCPPPNHGGLNEASFPWKMYRIGLMVTSWDFMDFHKKAMENHRLLIRIYR